MRKLGACEACRRKQVRCHPSHQRTGSQSQEATAADEEAPTEQPPVLRAPVLRSPAIQPPAIQPPATQPPVEEPAQENDGHPKEAQDAEAATQSNGLALSMQNPSHDGPGLPNSPYQQHAVRKIDFDEACHGSCGDDGEAVTPAEFLYRDVEWEGVWESSHDVKDSCVGELDLSRVIPGPDLEGDGGYDGEDRVEEASMEEADTLGDTLNKDTDEPSTDEADTREDSVEAMIRYEATLNKDSDESSIDAQPPVENPAKKV